MRSLCKVLSKHRIAGVKCLSILCVCMASLVFKGCIPENVNIPGYSPVLSLVSVPGGFVNYFEQGVSFGTETDEVEVVFKVDADWMMRVVDEDNNPVTWCSVSTDLGNAGLHKVKVRVEENVDYELRTADILLLALDNTKLAEIAVTQDSRKGFLLSLKDTAISFIASTIEVSLESNVEVGCEVMDADWIREQPQASRGLTSCVFVFDVDHNISHEGRVAHIRFYDSKQNTVDTLTVLQKGILVDLGLSVKWANCNMGATAPEEYGGYYAWGEAEVKSNYISSSSTAYGLSISELQSQGIVSLDGNLTAAYDAATVNWGSLWRMPTLDEIKELIDDCTWSWTTQNDVKGYKVTGPNGNSIFLPAAGYRYNTSFSSVGSYGYYWSPMPNSNSSEAYSLYFGSVNVGWDDSYRFYGYSIRPVWGERVTTGEVTDITTNGAKFSGTVHNASQPLACGIIYGTSSSLSSTEGTMVATTSSGNFSVSISGLTANTTYYYRAYVFGNGEYKYGEVKSFTTINPEGTVDLGLSVFWASCNVGAESPEKYGDYFAWGETESKASYNSDNSITNGLSTSQLEFRGIIGSDGQLTADYDAATVNRGSPWRMPTGAELQELCEKCSWSWTTLNGVNGYKVTGPNGNSIFLPATGYRLGTSLNSADSYGYYWSATPDRDSYYAYYLYFYSDDCFRLSSSRYYGRTVRPVADK